MSSHPDPDPGPPAADPADDSRLLPDVRRVVGTPCRDCGRPCTAREALGSIALGFKAAPRCLPCLARGLGRPADRVRADLVDYARRRDCYARAWAEAERLDGPDADWPPLAGPADAAKVAPPPEPSVVPDPVAAWDAGGMGCGELVLALRLRLTALPAGAVLKVTATDPAAPEDLPAWCRMTGHALVRMDHPEYLVRRREG